MKKIKLKIIIYYPSLIAHVRKIALRQLNAAEKFGFVYLLLQHHRHANLRFNTGKECTFYEPKIYLKKILKK